MAMPGSQGGNEKGERLSATARLYFRGCSWLSSPPPVSGTVPQKSRLCTRCGGLMYPINEALWRGLDKPLRINSITATNPWLQVCSSNGPFMHRECGGQHCGCRAREPFPTCVSVLYQ